MQQEPQSVSKADALSKDIQMEEQQGSLDHIYLTIERRTTKRVPK
jgi:hypothetical protein